MDINDITPFIKGVARVLGQFGLSQIKYKALDLKEEMIITKDVSAFMGIIGSLNGNVAYCFSKETAKSLASLAMMGMQVDEIDSIARSALAEVANMMTLSAIGILETDKIKLNVTPPTVISGDDITLILTFLNTHTVTLTTPIGPIEINVALEK